MISKHLEPLPLWADGRFRTTEMSARAGQHYVLAGVSPEEAFQAIGRLRKEAQDEIDRLLAFLDATDPDPDLEPVLGFPEVDPGRLAPSHAGGADDRETDNDFEDAGRAAS